jgi:hypothetical protein
MANKWVVIGGDAVTKNEKQRRYTRDEVEQRIAKALAAAGVNSASVGPIVDRLLPDKPKAVAKSAAQIQRERIDRQRELEADMERQRVDRLRMSEQRRLDLERSKARSADVARAAVTFVDGCGESASDVGGPVTRLDLSQPVAKRQRRGLFGEIVDEPATDPYTHRRRRYGR